MPTPERPAGRAPRGRPKRQKRPEPSAAPQERQNGQAAPPKANGHAPEPPRPRQAAQEAPRRPEPPERPPELAPRSVEAEQSVLGAILVDHDALDRVAAILRPDLFYRRQHAEIYEAMLALHHAGTPIDLTTLGDQLEQRHRLEGVGGRPYLTELLLATPTAVHVDHYARIVAHRALARRAIEGAGRIAAIGYEDANDPEQLLERLRSVVEGIAAGWTGSASSTDERLGARLLSEISTAPPPPLLIDRLDPSGHTVLFGTGGVGKGTLAASWIVALLFSGQRVLIVDYENHPDEWARRIAGIAGPGAPIDSVKHVAPLTAAWHGRRGPLWEQAADLRQLAIDFRADYMLVDSAVPACAGADPIKPETVALYSGGLEYIGLPALTLAHVTKADDLRYPFGSVFWHNLARITWSMKSSAGAVALTHRKHNNYGKTASKRVEVTWDQSGVPAEVWEREWGEFLAQRISAVLGAQSLTPTRIADLITEEIDDEEAEPIKPESVAKALQRGSKARPAIFVRVTEGSGRGREATWRNAD